MDIVRFQLNSRGFTLIELLVVISVIGLLSSIVLVAMNNTRQKAKYARVDADFHQIATQIELSRTTNNNTVLQITGSGCSDCVFRGTGLVNANAAGLAALATSWQRLGFSQSPKDPWGTPYLIDENERESGVSDCRNDQVFSAGPNGIDEVGSGDDISTYIKPFLCQ